MTADKAILDDEVEINLPKITFNPNAMHSVVTCLEGAVTMYGADLGDSELMGDVHIYWSLLDDSLVIRCRHKLSPTGESKTSIARSADGGFESDVMTIASQLHEAAIKKTFGVRNE